MLERREKRLFCAHSAAAGAYHGRLSFDRRPTGVVAGQFRDSGLASFLKASGQAVRAGRQRSRAART